MASCSKCGHEGKVTDRTCGGCGIEFGNYEKEKDAHSSGMYSNIGEKIKTVASIEAWIGIIIYVITGIILMVVEPDLWWVSLIIIGFGSLISWYFSLLIYGFGELIVKTTEIAKNTAKE